MSFGYDCLLACRAASRNEERGRDVLMFGTVEFFLVVVRAAQEMAAGETIRRATCHVTEGWLAKRSKNEFEG